MTKTTTYLVFRQDEFGPWKQIDTVDTISAKAAITRAISKLTETEGSGTFVAVPERSWSPLQVSAFVKTVIEFKPPDESP